MSISELLRTEKQRTMCRVYLLTIFVFSTLGCFSNIWAQSPAVLQSLLRESPEKLAAAAASHGDAARGANLFFQPALGCASCHATSDSGPMSMAAVGPKLTRPNPDLSDAAIVDAILRPSKSILKGFETTQVLSVDGQVLTGILISQFTESVQLRDPSTGKTIDIDVDEIESLHQNPLSVMPEGMAGQLSTRQQFLDLVRYLVEIRDGGARRARELQPVVLPSNEPLPEYEAHIDHAGLIGSLDEDAFKRGEVIYNRSCVNCHGTVAEPGSLPTSLRFASGKFKNGFDPWAMYQTVTQGFGLMTPQRWLVPEQKYDVIHYIREAYLKPHNPTQYATVDQEYLERLLRGDTRGPDAVLPEPWREMDYGPNLMATYEVGDDGSNIAYKGQAIRLDPGLGGVAQGQQFILYEHDTMRVAAAWSGAGFIDYHGINFDGVHQKHPRIVGDVLFANDNGPGWANPQNDSFAEVREPGRDGRFYGPLPKDWIDYQGTFVNGPETVLHYRVGTTEIHELPAITEFADLVEGELARDASLGAEPDVQDNSKSQQQGRGVVFQRQLLIGAAEQSLTMRVADRPECTQQSLRNSASFSGLWSKSTEDLPSAVFAAVGDVDGLEWKFVEGEIRLRIAASASPRRLTLIAFRAGNLIAAERVADELVENLQVSTRLLAAIVNSAIAKRWPETVDRPIAIAEKREALVVDTIEYPAINPWLCRMRLTGLDFYEDGESAAVCDWDGNVWRVSHLHSTESHWERIASGLFQPLGIKIRGGEIFVCCRNEICRLHDRNHDGEIDYYESFNHDHIITEHFHEFAMGLQCDDEGNFYYAKSARHALPAIVPHHGTLLKVSADGSHTEIVANGFRAANGVCLNGNGTFFVTDQEGHWNPKNRINWVKPGRFYGNMFGYHNITDSSDSAMTQPLCWITNSFDRSPAELLWVTSDQWGPLKGSLLNMSYGYGKLYVVPHELKGDQMQGGMCELPIAPLPTGIMRGRFHPSDGGLYLAGMFAWGGNQEDDGGFFRVRYTGKPLYMPLSLKCLGTTVRIGLSDDIDPSSLAPESFAISRWKINRTANYGSEHFDTEQLEVASVVWDAERRELVLDIPALQPTWCMEIQFDVRSLDGMPIHRTIHNTIHSIGSE